eukprot:COSAG01_NODE_6071_length_3869_cov_36.543767_2_plen_634_part_00
MKNFDYFRRVPLEFTEATTTGSLLSVIAAVVMGTLFVLEFRAYTKTTSVSDLVMDPGGVDGNDMFIAFKVTMPELVCQFASVEVSDMMGSERQGIHKDMEMVRIRSDNGAKIADYTWGEEKLLYEDLSEPEEVVTTTKKEPEPEKCSVTLYEHPDFTGWQATFNAGEYDHAALAAKGAANDDCESVVVKEGCYAVVAEHGEHDGWEIVLEPTGGKDGDGRYTGEDLEKLGTLSGHTIINGVSSMVVHEGTAEEAKAKAAKVKKGRAEGLPQRGQIDELGEGTFDQFMRDRPEKMVVVDFYAPWCHWCQLLDPVWKQTAESLPDQSFAKGVRMAKVDCEANRQLCMEHLIRAYPTIQTYTHGDTSPAETYYGDRTVDAFHTWMGHEYKILEAELATKAKDEADAKKLADANPDAAAAAAGDAGAGAGTPTPEYKHAGHYRVRGGKTSEGCTIEGRLRVKRIPGNFHINFVHDNMDYHNSLINATHKIDYLIFSSTPLPKPMTHSQIQMHNIMSMLEGSSHRLASSNTMAYSEYVSNHEDRTYEHFIQIVPTYNRVSNETKYRYTVSSAEHEDSERYPSAKFSFVISPMMVVISQKSTPLYHFLTNICALIGGLFTVFSMTNGVLDAIVNKLQGK